MYLTIAITLRWGGGEGKIAVLIVFRFLSSEQKVDIYVKIARLYLEDEESVQAEAYINRAAELIHQVTDDALRLKYKVTYNNSVVWFIFLFGVGLLRKNSGLQEKFLEGSHAVL
jgi:hypothetical protein